MNRLDCLTITTNYRSYKKLTIETFRYELMQTTESGDTRIIDLVEVEKVGKKKPTYRYQHKLMALPAGKYLNAHTWDDTQPDKFKNMVIDWLKIPAREVHKTHGGLSTIEMRYF